MEASKRHIPYPADWPRYYNGTNTPCDMADGPCVCGAWHSLGEWGKRLSVGISSIRRPTPTKGANDE